MQHHNFRLSPLGAPQSCFQRIERVVSAQWHEDVAGFHADIFQGEFAFLREIEFIELGVGFGIAFWSIISETSKTAKKISVKATPEIVATCLVKRLMKHKANKVRVISATPIGNLHVANFAD